MSLQVISRTRFNRVFDTVIRPEIRWFGRSVSAFQVCGCSGLLLAFVLGLALVAHAGLSPRVLGAVSLTAMGTFLALAMTTKMVTGEESLVYYRHEVAILVACGIVLWLLRQPVPTYLDVAILGVGTFLACGRMGCFMVGCCHGRPSRWGVCYRAEHVAAGFTPHYAGIRLFPIQVVEATGVAAIVIVGTRLVWIGSPAGEALAWYLVTYDVFRFLLEFSRGDLDRPYLAGFSEAQWLSVVLTWVVAGAELAGTLPLRVWHLGAAAGLSIILVGVILRRRFRPSHHYCLRQPRQVQDLAAVLAQVTQAGALRPCEVPIATTALGVRVSSCLIRPPSGPIRHYALSSAPGAMTAAMASTAARLILQLRHESCSGELLRGDRGVFHLLVLVPNGDEILS